MVLKVGYVHNDRGTHLTYLANSDKASKKMYTDLIKAEDKKGAKAYKLKLQHAKIWTGENAFVIGGHVKDVCDRRYDAHKKQMAEAGKEEKPRKYGPQRLGALSDLVLFQLMKEEVPTYDKLPEGANRNDPREPTGTKTIMVAKQIRRVFKENDKWHEGPFTTFHELYPHRRTTIKEIMGMKKELARDQVTWFEQSGAEANNRSRSRVQSPPPGSRRSGNKTGKQSGKKSGKQWIDYVSDSEEEYLNDEMVDCASESEEEEDVYSRRLNRRQGKYKWK